MIVNLRKDESRECCSAYLRKTETWLLALEKENLQLENALEIKNIC